MQKNIIRLNTTFYTPEKVRKKAIELSEKINEDYETEFKLDDENFYPHITIYAPRYPEMVKESLLEKVKEVAANIPPLELSFTEFQTREGLLGIGIGKSTEIVEAHKLFVHTLSPMRSGKEDDDWKMELNEKQKENIQKYGHPEVLDLYQPHLTIIRFEDEDKAEKAVEDLSWDLDGFEAGKIAVFEAGKHGACRIMVEEFNLGRR